MRSPNVQNTMNVMALRSVPDNMWSLITLVSLLKVIARML